CTVSAPHRPLPPFPTRRSSDLGDLWIIPVGGRGPIKRQCLFGFVASHTFLSVLRSAARCPPTASAVGRCRGRFWTLPCPSARPRSEEHTSELQSRSDLVCRLLL